jgi:hypothetical protein
VEAIDPKWHFQDRWKVIRAMEIEERRKTTFAERMRILDMLYEFARDYNLSIRPDDSGPVRAAWNRLHQHYEQETAKS